MWPGMKLGFLLLCFGELMFVLFSALQREFVIVKIISVHFYSAQLSLIVALVLMNHI